MLVHFSFLLKPPTTKKNNLLSSSRCLKIIGLLALISVFLEAGVALFGRSAAVTDPFTPSLEAAKVIAFVKNTAAGTEIKNMPARIYAMAFDNSQQNLNDLIAFEEHRLFVFAAALNLSRTMEQKNSKVEGSTHFFRRVIFLRPSIIVIDDEISGPASTRNFQWVLYSQRTPEIKGHHSHFVDADGELVCETLLPDNARLGVLDPSSTTKKPGLSGVTVTKPDANGRTRFLHVLSVRRQGEPSTELRSSMAANQAELELTISASNQDFRLSLPPVETGQGEIVISKHGGKTILGPRPFPAGILPHGPEGMGLLDTWDASYSGGKHPAWDAGRPSAELQRVVEQGIVRACRALDLGCGSGTDAIYLASKGFEVTAIDIAPSALSQGKKKAEKAGVEVRWLLADVLAVPKLEPFDFIFDRGCYHEVRFYSTNAYVDTVRKFSRPGTHFLLLAGNPNEIPQQYAPPQVAEEDIRSDFSSLFDFEWIRETRFETFQPNSIGPLAWSVMMRRKN
jgi:SAM-dependent methyltransferase